MQVGSGVLRNDLVEINAERPPESLIVVCAESVVCLQTAVDPGVGKIIDRNAVRDTVSECREDAFFGRH